MASTPLMPKATAVWLVDNTSLTFDQSFDGSYGGAVTGTGDVLFNGGGQVTLTGDSSGYQGETTVSNFRAPIP